MQSTTFTEIKRMDISSPSFVNNGFIPVQYTCDGVNISPGFNIRNIPVQTTSLAIIVEDPDAPINTWIHWLVWNIPVSEHIQENKIKGIEGLNDFCKHFYCGPCPMSGIHHYKFRFFALDTMLHLPPSSRKYQLDKAMSEHIIGYGELTAQYGRSVLVFDKKNKVFHENRNY